MNFKIPSVFKKWLLQDVFFSIAFFLTFCRELSNVGLFYAYDINLVIFDFTINQIFFCFSFLIFYLLLFIILHKTRETRRNSAMCISIAMLLILIFLLKYKIYSLISMFAKAFFYAFSFFLFVNSAFCVNRNFSQLFNIFGKKISKFAIAFIQFFIIVIAMTASAYCIESFSAYTHFITNISVIFLLLCLIVLANNNFIFRNRDRLEVYEQIVKANPDDQRLVPFRENLYNLFVLHHKLYFIDEIIMTSIRLIYNVKVVGEENLKKSDFPAIFVCNHGEEIGPICGMTFIPTFFYPWVDVRMCDYEKANEHMWNGTFKKYFKNEKLGRFFTNFIAKIVVYLICGTEPLKVAKRNPNEVVRLLQETNESLIKVNNILIFPEDPNKSDTGEHYQKDSTGGLYTGFAQIGKMYGMKTGRDLSFYPVFISKKKKTLYIGKPVLYNSKTENHREEKERIALLLQEKMNEFV